MEDIKVNNQVLTFKHRLKSDETFKISKSDKFYSISIYKKPQLVKGIASHCDDNKHVFFVDYDNVPQWVVEQDYKLLQENYNLPPGYLFYTKLEHKNGEFFGNFHIISLAKFYPRQVYEMLAQTHADINYMSMPLRRIFRNWVLRISTKNNKERPKFMKITGKVKNMNKEISRPHLDFLSGIYDLPRLKYKKLDKGKKIYLQAYETA